MDKDHGRLFKERLYFYLKEKNMTINRVSTLAGISVTTLSSIINRDSSPRIDTVYKICQGLDVSFIDFFDFPPYNQRPGGSSKKEEESKWEKLSNALTTDEKKRILKILGDEK